MATNPQTEVYLYKNVPFDPNNEHTVLWVTDDTKLDSYGTAAAKQEQEKYFTQTNKPSRSYSNYSYQRVGTNKIQIKDTYDNVSGHSYMRFRNQAHENKWWYCFITAIDYINENCTEVSYEVDLLQTYQFDWKLNECFVEREHSSTDNFGDNTVAEDFIVSDYEVKKAVEIYRQSGKKYGLLINATKSLQLGFKDTTRGKTCYIELGENLTGGYCNGIFTAGGFLYVPLDEGDLYSPITIETPIYYDESAAGSPALNDKMEYGWQYIARGIQVLAEANALISIYICPRIYAAGSTYTSQYIEVGETNYNDINQVFYPLLRASSDRFFSITVSKKIPISKPSSKTIKGVSYNNMKINNFPYNKVCLDDGQGNSKDFKYENFLGDECYFSFILNVVNNPEVQGFPLNYARAVEEKDYTIINAIPGHYLPSEFCNPGDIMILKGFPMCSVNIDAYNAWLAQNSVGEIGSIIGNIGQGAIAGASAGPVGAAIGAGTTAVSSITNSIVKQVQLANLSDTPSGVAGSSVQVQAKTLGFELLHKQARTAQLKQIDNFFSRFGYAVKDTKKPKLHNRRRFTYVKTTDSSIGGNFASKDRLKLEQIFNNGITFWASTHIGTIGAYPQAGIEDEVLKNDCVGD